MWNEFIKHFISLSLKACSDAGGALLEVNSQAEQDYLVSLLPDPATGYLTGAKLKVKTGEFLWSGSRDRIDDGFSCWGAGLGAAGAAEGCAVLLPAAQSAEVEAPCAAGALAWDDVACDAVYPVVCELP